LSPRRIDLEFAVARRTPRLGIALLAAGVLLAAAATARVADALAAHARYGEGLAELDASAVRASTAPGRKGPPGPGGEFRGLVDKQVAQSLQSPWADLLDAIEMQPAGTVALLAIEPSALKRTVRITAEASSAEAMLEHLSMLQQDPRLSGVTLVSHQRQMQAPGAPWRYQIQGSW
jgi:hypothetical protein